MEASVRKDRPKHLNLFVIRQPVAAFVSILHRVSGAGLFLMLPLLLWLFGASVNPDQADAFRAVADFWLVKLVLLGLLWAYLHHFCAGIRFLLLDVHVGIDLPAARNSAYVVLAVSLLLTAILGVLTW